MMYQAWGPAGQTSPIPSVSINLRTALQWTLTRNPTLATLRQDIPVSAAAWALASRFPTSLNPTVSLTLQPWTFVPAPGGGGNFGQTLVNIQWSQPIELPYRTNLRAAIAHASYDQTRFTVLQAELTAMVQTYQLYQTAVYRRDKLTVSRALVDFNDRLVQTLQRQVAATLATPADLVLARVEAQATRQKLEIATHEYVAALSDLRAQIGIPQYATTATPIDEMTLPDATLFSDDDALVRLALTARPEILADQAAVVGAQQAVALARAERWPIPSVGPVAEKDEAGVSYYGFVASVPVPILNAGLPLVRQREAESQRATVALTQTKQRVAAQVLAVLVKWHDAQKVLRETEALVAPVRAETTRMEHLYAAGESDIIKLLQVRLRLLDTDNGWLDALWTVTQNHAELLDAVGVATLLGSLVQNPEAIPAPRQR